MLTTNGWFKLRCKKAVVATTFPRPPALEWDGETRVNHLPVPDELLDPEVTLPDDLPRDVASAVMGRRYLLDGGLDDGDLQPRKGMAVVLLCVNTSKKSELWDFSFVLGVLENVGGTVFRTGYRIWVEHPSLGRLCLNEWLRKLGFVDGDRNKGVDVVAILSGLSIPVCSELGLFLPLRVGPFCKLLRVLQSDFHRHGPAGCIE